MMIKNSSDNKRNISRSIYINALYVTIVLVVICLISVAILTWSNPQRSKWVYIFQAYIYPRHTSGWIVPPKNFSGTWRAWYLSGRLRLEANYNKGLKHGLYKKYYDQYPLQMKLEFNYLNDKSSGNQLKWYSNGKLKSLCYTKDGIKDGLCIHWFPNGQLYTRGIYKDGKEWDGTFLNYDEKNRQYVKISVADGIVTDISPAEDLSLE